MLFGKPQHVVAPRFAQNRAGRVLHGRDRVDHLRPYAALLAVFQRRREAVHAHAVAVDRDADRRHAEPHEARERALIGVLLADHRVAAREQRAVDEIERLQRAGDHHDVVRRAGDVGVALELADQELAQRPVALRTAGETIGRKRAALAPQHGACRVDQPVDRHLVGIIVAAGEIVLRRSGPAHRGRRRSGRHDRCEIERPHPIISSCHAGNSTRRGNGKRGRAPLPCRFGGDAEHAIAAVMILFPTDLASFLELIRQNGDAAYSFVFAFAGSHSLLLTLFAGYAAFSGVFSLGSLIAVCWLGSFCGDVVRFWIARRFGTQLFGRFPRLERAVQVAARLADRHHVWMILSGIPWPTFLVLNFIAAGLWACAVVSAGYAFGRLSEKAMNDASSGFGAVMLVVFLGLSWMLSRKLERDAERS
jgi:membrane protein DedA with SNARE-associated domain